MHTSIIRNCQHGGAIVVGFVWRDEDFFYFKASCEKESIVDLKNEFNGLTWYESRAGKHLLVDENSRENNYFKFYVKKIHGTKVNYRLGVRKNKEIILKIIHHYMFVFPKGADVKAHGDLSLDNIIIDDEGAVSFLDWEHFSEGVLPFGFDLVYCILETLYFVHKNFMEKYCRKEMFCAIELLKELEISFGVNQSERPLRDLINTIKQNQVLWGQQLMNFRGKLPVLLYEDDYVSKFDSYFQKVRR